MSLDSPDNGNGPIILNVDITDLMINEYELLNYGLPGRLRFNEVGHQYNHPEIPIITTDHVSILQHKEDEGVRWEFNVEEANAGIDAGETQTGSREIGFKDKYKIRHEFVSEALDKNETDSRLRDYFEEENDEDDELTPDFIWKDYRGFYYVVEVSTTRNNTEDGLRRMYDLKAFKYRYALETRAMKNLVISYCIIIVSQDYVLSSVKLPRYLFSELIVRMRIGLALENLAKSKGFSLETDESNLLKTAYTESIKNHLSKIPFKIFNDNELNITREYINKSLTPSDHKEVFKLFLDTLDLTKNKIWEEDRDSVAIANADIERYIKVLKQNEGRRYRKPVINLPLILPSYTSSNVDIPDKLIFPDDDSVESKMWSIAFDDFRSERMRNVEEDPGSLLNEALETEEVEIEYYEKARKAQRGKYHRVSIAKELTTEEKLRIAEQGLWAKKYKREEFYKERKKESQRPFNWDVDLSDISDYLSNSNLLKKESDENSAPTSSIVSLIEHANKLIDNSDIGLESVKDWIKTDLYKSLDFLSDVAMELCISIKQNCKSGFGILKKLRYYDAYLLIFPTKSSEHLFFSLYMNSGKVLMELPFRRCYKMGDGYYTSLVSVKQSKLENWCSASSSLLSLVSFWSWFYDLKSDLVENFQENKEACTMLLLSVLVRLEDKSQTEEVITQMRYMYMESFKGLVTPMVARPTKILKKLTSFPRSRLSLWVIKQCLNNFLTMVKNPPIKLTETETNLIEGEDSLPKDSWVNLLNCFTGTQIQSASKVINLVYLGYLKNKNESPEGNSDFQLIEKTLEEEFKYNKDECKLSLGDLMDASQSKGKQFNIDCIKFGCEIMETRLERTLGSDWKEQIGIQIMSKLSECMTDTIASLKASSTVSHDIHPKECSYLDPISAMRIKVVEAVSTKLECLGMNPFTKLNEIINYIEGTSGGVIADLFKKQQHGGLREIYVLTLESRIVQLFIETISRTICSFFDEETLTHPQNKLRKLNEHRKLSARLSTKRNSLSVDLCSSNDKTRWNQNFVMPAMVIPLLRLTPTYLHNPICRIMNLWSSKLIKIPQSVCLHLLNKSRFSSEVYNTMLKMFWNPEGDSLFDFKAADCIRLKTGMMQGILHYTSSLLHLSLLNSSSRLITTTLQQWFPEFKFIVSQICSSDDSATMLSILSPQDQVDLNKSFLKAASFSSLCLESLQFFCKYYCMLESDKSTFSLIDYVEFNSEFMFQNTIAMPVIKFVAASQNLTESESFLDRFYTQYNLISDLFASGFTAEHTHICQIAQAFLHYKTLGSSTNALFPYWCELIVQWPDPKYGFFLLDESLCPGVLGYAYSHWNLCVKTSVFQGTIRELNMEPWITTPEGGITQTLIMKHGEVKRWKKLVKVVTSDINIKEEIEKDPSILFRQPLTKKEVELKLAIRVTSPGVAKSLRRGNPFIQAIATSVYALNTHSFTKTSVTQDFDVRMKKVEKVCLLGELVRTIESNKRNELINGDMRDFNQSLIVAFPNKHRYEECKKLFSQMRSCVKVECHRFRERKTEVCIQPRSAALPLSLKMVMGYRWFGLPIRASHKIYRRCYSAYSSTIPWLKGEIKDCLEKSPFTTYQELYNFISTDPEKNRRFRRNGPSLYSKRLVGQLYNLIRKSQRPQTVLIETSKRKYTYPSKDIITKLNLALSIPEPGSREHYCKKLLIEAPKLYDDLSSIPNMVRREATISYIQGVLKGDFTLEDVAIHMRDMGMGTHISYVQEQRKLIREDGSIKWLGKGICYIFIEGCQISLELNEDYLDLIRVDDWKRLKSNIFSLNQVVRDLGLKPKPDSSRASAIVAKYNGTHLVSRDSVGTPVLRLQEVDKIKFDPKDLIITVEQNELKIIQRVISSDRLRIIRDVTMLKYKLNHNDIILTHPGETSKEVWKAWINQSKCDIDILFGLIKKYVNEPRSKMFLWLQETIQSRLQFKTMGTFNIRYYDAAIDAEDRVIISTDEDEDEEIFNMIRGKIYDIQQFEDMGFLKIEKKEQTWVEQADEEMEEEDRRAQLALESLGMEDAFPLWVSHVKNWVELAGEASSSVIGPTAGSFMCVHPLWDGVIEEFSKERNTFWFEITDGRIPPGYDSTAPYLMKLLGITPKSKGTKIIGLSDRFEMAKAIRAEVDPSLRSPAREIKEEILEIIDETRSDASEDDEILGYFGIDS